MTRNAPSSSMPFQHGRRSPVPCCALRHLQRVDQPLGPADLQATRVIRRFPTASLKAGLRIKSAAFLPGPGTRRGRARILIAGRARGTAIAARVCACYSNPAVPCRQQPGEHRLSRACVALSPEQLQFSSNGRVGTTGRAIGLLGLALVAVQGRIHQAGDLPRLRPPGGSWRFRHGRLQIRSDQDQAGAAGAKMAGLTSCSGVAVSRQHARECRVARSSLVCIPPLGGSSCQDQGYFATTAFPVAGSNTGGEGLSSRNSTIPVASCSSSNGFGLGALAAVQGEQRKAQMKRRRIFYRH